MAEIDLLCNYRKCHRKIEKAAWVTACSHIFCEEHGTTEFSNSKVCPACGTKLDEKLEVIRQDLNLSDQHKAMLLCGQKPEVLIEVFSRAFSFYMYQVSQKNAYHEFVAKREKECSQQMELQCDQLLTRMKAQMKNAKTQLAELKREQQELMKKKHELQEQLTEGSRRFQKLQAVYDQLKRKSINPMLLGAGDAMADRITPMRRQARHVINAVSAADYFRKSTPPPEAEDDFVFRPVSTPLNLPAARNRLNVFNNPTHHYQDLPDNNNTVRFKTMT